MTTSKSAILMMMALLAGSAAAQQSQPSTVAAPAVKPAPEPEVPAVEQIKMDAAALEPLARSDLARQFLKATAFLPSVAPRKVLRDKERTHYYTAAAAARLPEVQRQALEEMELDESFYYNTRYGSPLAYTRPLEVLSENGLGDVAGKRVLDFGYGTIGHLRLLASLGADVVGVEVDPMLPVLYSEAGDTGAIKAASGRSGNLKLVDGQFPATDDVKKAVGDGYDLIVSKNVLKNGYIHPAEKVDPRRLVHLGVDEEVFLREVFSRLKPGGRMLIYNICPAPAPPGKPYIPWADGRSPFSRTQWEAAGFQVVALDRDDGPAVRAMAHALGWDAGEHPMDLEKDLFATWTLVRRPA